MFRQSKTQIEIRKAARAFAKGEFDKDQAYELEKKCEFPESIWKKAADLGFIGIHFPEEYGGGGLGIFENVLIVEEFCRKDSSIGTALALAGFASECVLRFASDELKEKFMPGIPEGQMLSGGAFSETRRGGDFTDIKTTAVKKDDEWIINGKKTHVLNGGNTGFYVVLCRTEVASDADEQGISMILVESGRPGVTFENAGRKLGGNMTATAEVSFNDVAVPFFNLIGKEGKGISQLHSFWDEARIVFAAQAIGNAQGAFDRTLEYIKGREQFGRKIAEFKVVQHKIADMATKIELARLITYKAALSMDNQKSDGKLSAMAKITAARTAMEVGAQAIQLFGGYGYMTEYEVERYYRDAKVIELLGGTQTIQKDDIAGIVIGKI